MSATEELRRLLDERGTEHTDLGGMTEWTNGCGRVCRAHTRPEPLTVDVAMLAVPPEQAIAATLGSDREAELQKALNKAAGNWAKADDELRKALDFMRIWISEDAHLGESAISRELEKAEGLRNLDAIESAIAVWNTRAERTCDNLANHQGCKEFVCSECGAHYLGFEFAYCPNCGAKVVDA